MLLQHEVNIEVITGILHVYPCRVSQFEQATSHLLSSHTGQWLPWGPHGHRHSWGSRGVGESTEQACGGGRQCLSFLGGNLEPNLHIQGSFFYCLNSPQVFVETWKAVEIWEHNQEEKYPLGKVHYFFNFYHFINPICLFTYSLAL